MKKKGGKSFLRQGYGDSWDYLKESKVFIFSAIVVFFIFALVGFLFPAPEFISQPILKLIEDLVARTQGLNTSQLVLFIFTNNVWASFLALTFGIILGIYPFLSALLNGYLLGFVGRMVTSQEGIGTLWKILPHGIFELPAIFIAFGLGMKLGTVFFKKNFRKTFKEYIKKSLEVLVFVIIPLLIIASIIEGSLIGLFS